MNVRCAVLVLSAIVAIPQVSSRDAVAQSASLIRRTSLALGLGVGTQPGVGLSGVLELTHQRGAHLFAIRWARVMRGGSGALKGDFGILYGRESARRGASGPHFAAVGLSVVGVGMLSLGSGTSRWRWTTIGIPVEVGTTVNAWVVGLGLRGFANLNAKETFAGVALVVTLGDLR